MNRPLFYFFLFAGFMSSCSHSDNRHANADRSIPVQMRKHTIALLPFKGTGSNLIIEIKKGLQKELLAEISVIAERYFYT